MEEKCYSNTGLSEVKNTKLETTFRERVKQRIESDKKNYPQDFENNLKKGKYLSQYLDPKPTDKYYNWFRDKLSQRKATEIINSAISEYNTKTNVVVITPERINLEDLDADKELKDRDVYGD